MDIQSQAIKGKIILIPGVDVFFLLLKSKEGKQDEWSGFVVNFKVKDSFC